MDANEGSRNREIQGSENRAIVIQRSTSDLISTVPIQPMPFTKFFLRYSSHPRHHTPPLVPRHAPCYHIPVHQVAIPRSLFPVTRSPFPGALDGWIDAHSHVEYRIEESRSRRIDENTIPHHVPRQLLASSSHPRLSTTSRPHRLPTHVTS